MPKIDDHIIQRIIATARIEEVAEDLLGTYSGANSSGLKKQGVRFTALCPFHADRHLGNFVVYPRKNIFKCFACDAKGGVVDFVMRYNNMSFPDAIRWLGHKYNIDIDDSPMNTPTITPRPQREPLPTFIVPRQLFERRVGHLDNDPLVLWLRSQPWDAAARARLDEVLTQYCVGHVKIADTRNRTSHEFTAFWQLDKDGNPRTAHYMMYKPNGHRMHKEDAAYNTDWFHSLLSRPRPKLDAQGYPVRDAQGNVVMHQPFINIYDDSKCEARQCLFGEHLLSRYPNATVNIVESEKTAIIMATAYGNSSSSVWMACCGASNITRERLAPLIYQGRKVMLYPDRDGIDYWRTKLEGLNYDRATLNTQAVTEWWKPCDGDKADIADVVLRIINEHSPQAVAVGTLIKKNPHVKQLINNLNLEPL